MTELTKLQRYSIGMMIGSSMLEDGYEFNDEEMRFFQKVAAGMLSELTTADLLGGNTQAAADRVNQEYKSVIIDGLHKLIPEYSK